MACIHIKFGKQGSGKTLSAVYDLQQAAYDPVRKSNCYNAIRRFNSMGYNFSFPEIMSACDFDCEVHHFAKAPVMAYFVNGFYIGLPNENMRTMRLPPYTFIVLDEGNKYFNSRNDKIMPQWRSRFFELMRHMGYEVTICCQRPGLVDLNVRELADFTEYLGVEKTYDCYGKLIKIDIHYRYFECNADVENYLSSNKLPSYCKDEILTINCSDIASNIPAYYNSQFFENLFLKDCENKDWDLLQGSHDCGNVEDVQNFNRVFDYRVPKALYKDK